MGKSTIFEAVIIAFGMVSWPILGKYSQAAGPWVGLLVMSSTAVFLALLASMLGHFGHGSLPSARASMVLVLAGLINAAAMYRYTIRTSSEAATGKYLVLVAVLVVLEAPFVDLALNQALLTPKQWLGVACGVASIYFLSLK